MSEWAVIVLVLGVGLLAGAAPVLALWVLTAPQRIAAAAIAEVDEVWMPDSEQ